MLEICDLKKSFKQNHVLKGVSFAVEQGAIVCLLGNNGAGKTTIINCILKMIAPDSGKIKFDGKNISDIKNQRYFADVSALLESSVNIYDYLTGWQNIEYFAGLLNLDKTGLDKARQYVEEFDLCDSINQPAGIYSRGMQQKLALIISLMSKPRILLLDEPTLGLDIQSKLSVIKILNRIVVNERIGVLLTSHQMDVVEKLNGNILLLRDGHITAFDINANKLNEGYCVSYIEEDHLVQERIRGDFSEAYSKFKDKQIVEIKLYERTLEESIMEELYEPNKG